MLRFLSRHIGWVYCFCLSMSIGLALPPLNNAPVIRMGIAEETLTQTTMTPPVRAHYVSALRHPILPPIRIADSPPPALHSPSLAATWRLADSLTQRVMNEPSNKALNIRLTQAQIRAGHLDSAAATLARILFFAPDDVVARLDLARLEITRQKYPQARDHLEILLARDNLSASEQAQAQMLYSKITVPPTQAPPNKWQAHGQVRIDVGIQGNALQATSDSAGFTTDIMLYTYDNNQIIARPFIAYNTREKIDAAYIVSQIAVHIRKRQTRNSQLSFAFTAQNNRQFADAFDNESRASAQIGYRFANALAQYSAQARLTYQKSHGRQGFATWDAHFRGAWKINKTHQLSAILSIYDTTPDHDSARESQTSLHLGAQRNIDTKRQSKLDAILTLTDYRSSRATYESHAIGLRLGGGAMFTSRLRGYLSVAIGRRDYAQPYLLNGGIYQHDRWQIIRAHLTQKLKGSRRGAQYPSIRYSLTYRNVTSNIALESYHALGGNISVGWVFGYP